MIRTIITGFAAAALLLLGGGVAAAADVTTSNDAVSHNETSYEGGSYDSGTSNTAGGRIVVMDGVKHVLKVVGHDPVTGEPIWKSVPISNGVDSIEIDRP